MFHLRDALWAIALLLPTHTLATEASAEAAADTWRLGFGLRVGGYGFREPSGGSTSWEDCRMDGMGVFSSIDLDPHFFGEVGLDYYQANAGVVEDGMDRESGHLQVAVGARMFPDFFLTPYVQIGGGAEWTKMSLPATGAEREDVFPTGFLGLGAELNITESLKLGSSLRMYVMAHPAHEEHGVNYGDSTHAVTLHALTADDEKVPVEYGAAGQLQFFLRYAL